MAQGPKAVQNTLQWIADEQKIHETAEHGSNHKSVSDALDEQTKRVQLVTDYKKDLDKVVDSVKKAEDKEKINNAYDSLHAVAHKRRACLEDISQVAGLEQLFGTLTVEFAQRATNLVQNEAKCQTETPPGDGEGIAIAAHSCILAVKNNWNWISKLVKCADIHLQHVSAYHKFFHEIKEYKVWMPIELNKVTSKVTLDGSSSGKEDTSRLLLELKDVLTTFLHWQGKLDTLFDHSKKILPIHLRNSKLDHYRPVSALCNYRTKEINITESEELTLLDNSKSQSWLVRNMHGTETHVPSVTLLIPGPDPEAVNAAIQMRLELLGIWTENVKRIGKTLIAYLLLVIKDWSEDEKKKLRAMPLAQKQEIIRVMKLFEDALSRYWSEYPDFKLLQTRMELTRNVLAEDGDPKDADSQFTTELMVQLGSLDQLMRQYQDLWRYWETYRILVETCKHAEYILVVDKWQDLRFMDSTELLKKWHSGFKFGQDETDMNQNMVREEMISKVTTATSQSMMNGSSGHMYGSEEEVSASADGMLESAVAVEGMVSSEMVEGMVVSGGSVRERAETEQLTTASQEEKKTFVITGVMDPRSGHEEEEISMHQAVILGIINSAKGVYVNPDNGETVPIPVAMTAGKIKVEFTTSKKSAEKRTDVGLITIRIERDSRPYTVKAVIDAKTDKRLNIDEAIAAGILDQKREIFKNTMNDTEMSLADALDSGLLIVEFDNTVEVADPEVVSKTYAIHGVVNQKTKKKVTFTEAVRQKLLDKETGAYYHNVTSEHVYVGDAIKKGFIKATVVKDPSSMDIDPENKMVIQKIETIKAKMLRPLQAMSAFKKAAAEGKKNGKSEGKKNGK